MKRMVMLFLILLAVLLCGMPVLAEETGSDHEAETAFDYIENGDGTITVTGCVGFLADLYLPEEINDKTVTAVGEAAFMQRPELCAVHLPETVKTVGRQAFYGCPRLTNVTLAGVESLGEEAFSACTELRSISLGDKLIRIEKGAFEGCKLLGAIDIPKTLTEIGTDAFLGCEQVRFSVGDNDYARNWANAHNIPLSFWESDTFTLLLLCAISAVGALLLWFGWSMWKRGRSNKQKGTQENA